MSVSLKASNKFLYLRSHSLARFRNLRYTTGVSATAFDNKNNSINNSICGSNYGSAFSSLRSFSSSVLPFKRTAPVRSSDLPYHIVVGMPALSPTMESGGLAEWYVAEGDTFSAGDALAKIETDKASIDFEAQDDGCVAKLLIEDGTGNEINVNEPIMITVEEEEDLAAFKDYVYVPEKTKQPTEPESAQAPKVEPSAAVAAPPPPPPPTKAKVPSSPPPPAAETPSTPPVVATPLPPTSLPQETKQGPSWGVLAKVNSPIAKTLGNQQQLYIEKYGTTGQIPL